MACLITTKPFLVQFRWPQLIVIKHNTQKMIEAVRLGMVRRRVW